MKSLGADGIRFFRLLLRGVLREHSWSFFLAGGCIGYSVNMRRRGFGFWVWVCRYFLLASLSRGRRWAMNGIV